MLVQFKNVQNSNSDKIEDIVKDIWRITSSATFYNRSTQDKNKQWTDSIVNIENNILHENAILRESKLICMGRLKLKQIRIRPGKTQLRSKTNLTQVRT